MEHHKVVAELLNANWPVGELIHFKVVSNSMVPLIRQGDYVWARRFSLASVRPGDILVIRRFDDFVTHRLVAVSKDMVITKGDYSFYPDFPTHPDTIIARVEAVQRGERLINLNQGRWKMANRIIGFFSGLQVRLYFLAKHIKELIIR